MRYLLILICCVEATTSAKNEFHSLYSGEQEKHSGSLSSGQGKHFVLNSILGSLSNGQGKHFVLNSILGSLSSGLEEHSGLNLVGSAIMMSLTEKSSNRSYYSKSSDEYNLQDVARSVYSGVLSSLSSGLEKHSGLNLVGSAIMKSLTTTNRNYYSKSSDEYNLQDVARSVLDSIDPTRGEEGLQNFVHGQGDENTNTTEIATEGQGGGYANSTGGGNVVNEANILDRMSHIFNHEGGSIELKIVNFFEQQRSNHIFPGTTDSMLTVTRQTDGASGTSIFQSFVLAQLNHSFGELQALVTRRGLADMNISAGTLIFLGCVCMGGIVLFGLSRYCLKYVANSSIDSTSISSTRRATVDNVTQADVAKKAPSAFGKHDSWDGRQRDMSDKKVLAQNLLAGISIGDATAFGKSASAFGKSATAFGKSDSFTRTSDSKSARHPKGCIVLDESSDEESFTSQLRPSLLPHVHGQSLLPHLHGEHAQSSSEIRYRSTFVAASHDGEERSFRWVSPDEATAAGLLMAGAPLENSYMVGYAGIGMQRHEEGVAGPPIPAPWTVDHVKRVLRKHEVDVNSWDKDRLEKLVSELSDQKSFLMVTLSGNLRRVVDFLELMIVHPGNGHVCVTGDNTSTAAATTYRAVKQFITESRLLSAMQITPWLWKDFGESYQEAAHRCLEKTFGVSVDVFEIDWGKVKSEDNEETSDYFPGLTTIVHKRYIAVTVVAKDPQVLASLGIGTEKPSFLVRLGNDVLEWTWKPVEKVPQLIKHRKFLGMSQRSSLTGRELVKSRWQSGLQAVTRAATTALFQSDNLAIVVPWEEGDIQKLLEECNTKPDDFGMTLQDLTSEASAGTLYFSFRGSDGKLVCVRDKILVRVISPNGQAVLVEQRKPDSGGTEVEIQWPHSIRRINENAWDTGRRVARIQLQLQDDTVEFYSTPHELPSTSEGARVLSRAWITSGHIPESKAFTADNIHASEV